MADIEVSYKCCMLKLVCTQSRSHANAGGLS